MLRKLPAFHARGFIFTLKIKMRSFSASIRKAVDDGLQAANKMFDDERLTLEAKLLKALDEWFGRHVGLFHPEASDLGAQCERLLGDAVEKKTASFQKKLEKAILASSAKKTKGADKRAATIADMLCACGLTWKHSLSSRQEFLEKMRGAIHLCCQDL